MNQCTHGIIEPNRAQFLEICRIFDVNFTLRTCKCSGLHKISIAGAVTVLQRHSLDDEILVIRATRGVAARLLERLPHITT